MENETNPIGGQEELKPPVVPVVTGKSKLDIFSIFGQSFEDFKVLWRGVLKFYLTIIGFLILSFLLLMIPVILLVGLKAFSAFNNGSVDFSGGLSGGATFIVAGIIFIAALFFYNNNTFPVGLLRSLFDYSRSKSGFQNYHSLERSAGLFGRLSLGEHLVGHFRYGGVCFIRHSRVDFSGLVFFGRLGFLC